MLRDLGCISADLVSGTGLSSLSVETEVEEDDSDPGSLDVTETELFSSHSSDRVGLADSIFIRLLLDDSD